MKVFSYALTQIHISEIITASPGCPQLLLLLPTPKVCFSYQEEQQELICDSWVMFETLGSTQSTGGARAAHPDNPQDRKSVV